MKLARKKRLACMVMLFASFQARAMDIFISRAEAEAAFLPEFSKSFSYSWAVAASGLVELNRSLSFSAGALNGRVRGQAEEGAFITAEYGLPWLRPFFPLYVKAACMYNNIFDASTLTLLPVAGLHWRWFGFDAGVALRRTVFNPGEAALFEPVFAYSVYVSPYHTDAARISLRLSTFGDFEARHPGAYSLYLDNRVRVNRWISLRCEIEAAISGNVGQITSVYGLTFREGVVITW